HHVVDVMDMVVLDEGEHAAHASADAVLFAVMDVAAADDMASHLFFEPAVVLSPAHGIPLHLGRAFDMFCCEIMVIVRIQIFSQRATGTFAVADITVLDDPSL